MALQTTSANAEHGLDTGKSTVIKTNQFSAQQSGVWGLPLWGLMCKKTVILTTAGT